MIFTGRRIHCQVGKHLQHVVLDHVADRPGLVVEVAAVLHAELLRHRDLDAADVVAVPDRLEDRVGESRIQNVLHRLLAEVVVDAENAFLGKLPVQDPVKLLAEAQIVAERLFDHDARVVAAS